jgi:hypothetical protein
VLEPLGIKVPLGIKRGYHRHYDPKGNASLSRPVIDTEYGYALTPMEQGIRLTTGAEFAARDAAPTPVQFDRLMPHAKELFPLGEPNESEPWLGRRPNMPDSLAGARPRAGAERLVARVRPRALGADARPGDRAADRRHDDRRDAVRRPGALSGGAVSRDRVSPHPLLEARPSAC